MASIPSTPSTPRVPAASANTQQSTRDAKSAARGKPAPIVRKARSTRERWLIVATLAIVVAAWLYGYFAGGADVAPLVPNVLPAATTITRDGALFIGHDASGAVVGYAATGGGLGYGGPLEVLVGVDGAGNLLGVEIVEQRESPGFFRLVTNSRLFETYLGAHIQDPLQLGADLDSISGATMSAEGVAGGVRAALGTIARDALASERPAEQRAFQFGAPEIVLILLFGAGYVGHKLRNPRAKRAMRWGTLIAGMIIIGFLYTLPLTISMVISLLAGYWPDIYTNLYWYLLIGGILFVTTVDAKNPYCSWFCPFGAFQECLAAVTKVKTYRPRDLNGPLQWLQRGLALLAIVLGLALRNPGAASYEPFATLFDLRGGMVQWALLLIVVLASLIMYRPFCNYLCPLDPVVDFIAAGRRWLKDTGMLTWRRKAI